jgi:hypothetical protein
LENVHPTVVYFHTNFIINDPDDNKFVDKSYEGGLTGKTLDEVEQLVYKAKSELANDAEHEILALNQSEFSKKKQLSSKRTR